MFFFGGGVVRLTDEMIWSTMSKQEVNSIRSYFFCSIYMLPREPITCQQSVSFHRYADDTQLHVPVKPSNPKTLWSNCLDVNEWMSKNLVTLNENKVEILPVGPNYKSDAVLSKLGHLALQTWSQVRNLGIILDSYLTFTAHFNSLTRTAFGLFA